MSVDPEIRGYTTRIMEYTRVEGVILRPAEAVVKYGTILRVDDRSQGKSFLVMVVDVKEETTHPALDVERFKELYLKISEARYLEANKVLEELFSPQQDLIRWSSIMTVDLRVLGSIEGQGLTGYERPPRPMSTITEPDPVWLEGVIHSSMGSGYRDRGIYIGTLSINPRVRVYLNPERLDTHVSILAQTGAGKTETVKRLIAEASWRRSRIGYRKGGIVVFDIAGEYTGYPYIRADTVPLLDAVMYPEHYGGGDRPSQATILVPYELSRASTDTQRDALWSQLVDMACRLSSRLSTSVDLVLIHSNTRLAASIGPGECGGRSSRIQYHRLYNLLESSGFLIVAHPMPGFATVEDLVDMTGTRSEYFEVLISDMASALDSIDGQDIYGIHLMNTLSNLRLSIERMSHDMSDRVISNLIEAFRGWCSGRDAEKAIEEARLAVGGIRSSQAKDLFFDSMRYLGWLSYREGLASPRESGEKDAVCSLIDASPEEAKAKLREAIHVLWTPEYDRQTLRSLRRALLKASRQMSSVLDPILFNVLMERLARGFAIIHIAPPSLGNVDVILGLLVRRLFNIHSGRYESGRLTLLVVEEAHNLAPAGVEKSSKEALLRVAREGRKWGLSLWLVSQRPSFIDSGILSQTATSILLRTTNPEDLSMIKRGVESVAAEMVDRLPELEPTRGEALVVGLAAPERRIPLLVNVERLKPIPRREEP